MANSAQTLKNKMKIRQGYIKKWMVGCPTREMRMIINQKRQFHLLKRCLYQCVLVICVYKGLPS